MNLEQIMQEVDVLYQNQKVDEVQTLLEEKVLELQKSKEIFPVITLLNELLGIYRETGNNGKGENCCLELLDLFLSNSLPQDENYATTLLNIATAHRAFGNFALSRRYYGECLTIYQEKIPAHDYRFASLYNNLSLLYMELSDFDGAIENLNKSLYILEKIPGTEVQIATANTSLAQIYMNLKDLNSAKLHSDLALEIFKVHDDYHYSATLATAADIAFLSRNFSDAAVLYENAMVEIEKYLGKSENYQMLAENLKSAQELMKPKGMDLCRDFYNEFGAAMIAEDFPEYAAKIAVGLVGPGSECYGFDDEISQDHDFAPRFCMWLPKEVYSVIGEKLQQSYDNLLFPDGNSPSPCHLGEKRDGVFEISAFYEGILGIPSAPSTEIEWLFLEESLLAEACNGAVFRDDLGQFSEIRTTLLGHYPKDILSKKVAEKSHNISQMGQYNFQRCLKRGDVLTARITLSNFMLHSFELICLLNQTYAPYYKWTHEACKKSLLSQKILQKFQEIEQLPIEDSKINPIIEEIISEFIQELNQQGFIQTIKKGNFLDDYVKEILS